MPSRWLALFLSSCFALAAPALACPLAQEVQAEQLYGLWRAEFAGQLPGATLLFEKHPELAGSVRGAVNRQSVQALVAGDVDDGEFTLEESHDGLRIAATWLGTVVPASCGQEIRGTWRPEPGQKAYPFVLKKLLLRP